MLTYDETMRQVINYLDGPYQKGMDFDRWADSKDFDPDDRKHIRARMQDVLDGKLRACADRGKA